MRWNNLLFPGQYSRSPTSQSSELPCSPWKQAVAAAVEIVAVAGGVVVADAGCVAGAVVADAQAVAVVDVGRTVAARW